MRKNKIGLKQRKLIHYLPYYIGCKMRVSCNPEKPDKIVTLLGIIENSIIFSWDNTIEFIEHSHSLDYDGEITDKPYLRELTSLTEAEAIELGNMIVYQKSKVKLAKRCTETGFWKVFYSNSEIDFWLIDGKLFNQFQTDYLLTNKFDIFGLIKEGLAIPYSKLPKES